VLAKVVDHTAGILKEHGALEFFASKLAPAVSCCEHWIQGV